MTSALTTPPPPSRTAPGSDDDAAGRKAAGGAVPPARRTRILALPEARWATAALLLFLLALPLWLAGAGAWSWGPLFALCYAAGGWEPGWAGLRALKDRTLDVDLLMIVAALGAAAVGQVLDGALLIVIFATSGALEAYATARTADSVRGLLDLAPATAVRLTGDGGQQTVPTGELAVGDTILVRPGTRIGADGRVLAGVSEVDQATITGEPLPVLKELGDEVFAGTLNGTGALRVTVERDAGDTVIARIVRMVAEASETKAPTQLFIEKAEQRYSLGMVAATLAVFLVPLTLGAGLTGSLLRAMTFMIIASPCAVVLATMPPLLSAIANAGRHGVLVKSAVVMERLGQVDAVALDKTGTLTEGTPRVTGIRPLPGSGLGPDELLALAAAAEHPSEHPLARAVVAAARDRGLRIAPAAAFGSTPGVGVTATVDGTEVSVGAPARILHGLTNPANGALQGRGAAFNMRLPPRGRDQPTTGQWSGDDRWGQGARAPQPETDGAPQGRGELRDQPPTGGWSGDDPDAPARSASAQTHARTLATQWEAEGHTVVIVTRNRTPVGVLSIADRLRPGAAATVAALTTLTGAAPILLTGDNPRAARLLAASVRITDVRAGLLPQDKVAAVREQEGAGRRVLVVGDGVNDAPALAAAHTGIAMGRAGSDLALEAADAVVVRDELATVPALIELSRQARRLVVQNLAVACVCIAALVTWDLAGTLPLPLGVLGHEGSTVLVGLNGLRLLRWGRDTW